MAHPVTQTVGLATSHSPRRPRVWRATVGTHTETRSGAYRPDKRKDAEGRFWIAILESGAKDSKGHLPVHKAMQAALVKATGEENPTYLPIRVLSNNIDEVMHAERAAFWGRRRWCHCSRFWVKTKEEAQTENLAWPWGDGEGVPPDVLGNEVYYHGLFEREDAWGPGLDGLLCPGGRGVCNPSDCPIATGEHGVAKHTGKSLCKPHIRIEFKFDDEKMDLPPGCSPYGHVTTTSWNSHGAMTGTWWDTYNNEAAGWMPGAPLRLRVGKEQRTPRGQSKSQDIPVWSIEANGSRTDVLAAVKALAKHRSEVEQLLAGDRLAFGLLPESTGYQAETAAEFHPGVANEEPAWHAEAVTLMVRLGLSEGTQQAQLANVLNDNEDADVFLERLRDQVKREENDEPIDTTAEPMDEPEDEAPTEITQAMLTEYAIANNIPESTMLHIGKVVGQKGLAKGSPERRAFIMSEMVTLVERRELATDENGQGALM